MFSTLQFLQWLWELLTHRQRLSLRCSKAQISTQASTFQLFLKSQLTSATSENTMLLWNQNSSEQTLESLKARFQAVCFLTSKASSNSREQATKSIRFWQSFHSFRKTLDTFLSLHRPHRSLVHRLYSMYSSAATSA